MTVASSGTAKVTLPTDEQILITREFDAPRHLVYRAWTTPELVRRWWSGKECWSISPLMRAWPTSPAWRD